LVIGPPIAIRYFLNRPFINPAQFCQLLGADQKNTVFAIRIEDGALILRPLTRAEQKEMIKKAAKGITEEQAPILKKLAK